VTSVIVAVKFYHKIPLFRRIENRYAKFFAKTFLIFIPMSTYGAYTAYQGEQVYDEIYKKTFENYRRFKFNGNIKDLNEDINLC